MAERKQSNRLTILPRPLTLIILQYTAFTDLPALFATIKSWVLVAPSSHPFWHQVWETQIGGCNKTYNDYKDAVLSIFARNKGHNAYTCIIRELLNGHDRLGDRLLTDLATTTYRQEYHRRQRSVLGMFRYPPLIELCQLDMEYPRSAQVLIRHKANVNECKTTCVGILQQTPLHLAARKGFVEIARLLLENKADLSSFDKVCLGPDWWRRYTPLHYASAEGQIEVAKLLLQYKADPRDHIHEFAYTSSSALDVAGTDAVRAVLQAHVKMLESQTF